MEGDPEEAPGAAADQHRDRIVQEIVQSEQSYHKSLRYLVKSYLHPLRDAIGAGSPIITGEQLARVFSSVELIVNVNEELLVSLEERMEAWSGTQLVGDVFLELAPYLKLYTQYSSSYDDAMKALEQCRKSRATFVEFLQNVEPLEDQVWQDITFYLIMPIQRIPRYILLLTDLLKHTGEEHPDYQNLQSAVEQVRKVAVHVNESIRHAENINKILEIQMHITGVEDLVAPTRRFVGELQVQKISTKSALLPRHLFLFNDLVVLAVKKNAHAYTWKMTTPLHLLYCRPLPDTDRFKNVIQLIGPPKTLVFCFNDLTEKEQFLEDINGGILHLLDVKPGLEEERKEVLKHVEVQKFLKVFDIDAYVSAEEAKEEKREKEKKEERDEKKDKEKEKKEEKDKGKIVSKQSKAMKKDIAAGLEHQLNDKRRRAGRVGKESSGGGGVSKMLRKPTKKAGEKEEKDRATAVGMKRVGPALPELDSARFDVLRSTIQKKVGEGIEKVGGARHGVSQYQPSKYRVYGSMYPSGAGANDEDLPSATDEESGTKSSIGSPRAKKKSAKSPPTSPRLLGELSPRSRERKALKAEKAREKRMTKAKEKEEKLRAKQDEKEKRETKSLKESKKESKKPTPAVLSPSLNASRPLAMVYSAPAAYDEHVAFNRATKRVLGGAEPDETAVPSRSTSKPTKDAIAMGAVKLAASEFGEADMEGFLNKKGGVRSNWKKRYFVLKSRFLLYYDNQNDVKPLNIIPLRGYCVEEYPAKPNGFLIQQPNSRTFHMSAPNHQAKVKWMTLIKAASWSKGAKGVDQDCVTALLKLLHWPGDDLVQTQAGTILVSFFSDPMLEKSAVKYLLRPEAIQLLALVLQHESDEVFVNAQTAVLNAISVLAALEEISLICMSCIEFVQVSIDLCKVEQPGLREGALAVLSKLTREPNFLHIGCDWQAGIEAVICECLVEVSPLTASARRATVVATASSNAQTLAATIVRNLSRSAEFREFVCGLPCVKNIFALLATTKEEAKLEKLVQALYFLLAEHRQCPHALQLKKEAAKENLNLLMALFSYSSPTLVICALKTLNLLTFYEPELLEKVNVKLLPPLIEHFTDTSNLTILSESVVLLYILSKHRCIRPALDADIQVIKRLVEIIDSFSEAHIIIDSLCCLTNLVSSDKNKKALRLLGGVQPLVALLRTSDIFVLEHALRCLAHALVSERNKRSFLAAGLVPVLVDLLNREEAPNIQYRAAVATELFTSPFHSSLANSLVEDERDVVLLLLQLLNSPDERLRIQSTRCLAVLSTTKLGRDAISKRNGLRLLDSALQDKMSRAEFAAGALCNLFLSAAIREKYYADFGLIGLLQLMCTGSEVEQERAIAALTHLARHDASISAIIRQNNTFAAIQRSTRSNFNPLRSSAMVAVSVIENAEKADPAIAVSMYRPSFLGYSFV